jgi:hypothetical protein
MNNAKPRVGDWMEVRSKEEILKTLDREGQVDGMPFMPEMLAFCGKRFQVHKRAHKTCDTVFPIRSRRVDRTVHLETRCDGSAHGGCEAGCLIFWKEAWLKPVRGNSAETPSLGAPGKSDTRDVSGCTEADVSRLTQISDASGREPTYVCQATRLPYATTDLEWWDIRQYFEDYSSGNVTLGRMITTGCYSLYYHISQAGLGLGPTMRWLYDKVAPLFGGTLFPRKTGTIPAGQPTPAETLNLQPGELVRVKSYKEILQTLDTANKNRGLYFDAEEVPFCGQPSRVLRRLTKIIDEQTGKMQPMKTPVIILDSAVCQARYSQCRLFCPRGIYSYWREIWIERVGPGPAMRISGDSTSNVSVPPQTEGPTGVKEFRAPSPARPRNMEVHSGLLSLPSREPR